MSSRGPSPRSTPSSKTSSRPGRVFVLANREDRLVFGSLVTGLGIARGPVGVVVARVGASGDVAELGSVRGARPMRSIPRLDPSTFEYGEATEGIVQLMRDFGEIDWFVPAPVSQVGAAIAAFRELHRGGSLVLPEKFPTRVEPTIARGGWNTLLLLTARARAGRGWDWRHGALKMLARRHTELNEWSREEFAKRRADVTSGDRMDPNALYFFVGDGTIWNTPFERPDLSSVEEKAYREVAHWYWSYAVIDLSMAIEWQLAEGSSELEGNPFAALLTCYRAGYLPFCFGPDEVTLFAFKGVEAIYRGTRGTAPAASNVAAATRQDARHERDDLVLVHGDIANARVDAIINAWNRNFIPDWLLVPQGVSKALRQRGGPRPFQEIRTHGLLPLGAAVATSPGRLETRWVIHVAALHAYWAASERSVRLGYENALRVAGEIGAWTIATPLLGAGTGGLAPERSLALLREAWEARQDGVRRCEVWVVDEARHASLGG